MGSLPLDDPLRAAVEPGLRVLPFSPSTMPVARTWQMVLLVVAVSAASYAATAMNPLQETMRIALALTDKQMALLQGPAVALPMAAAAVPLGLLIDRYSRVRLLLALTAADLFGGVLTALASNFVMLG